jgi:site-specific DNA-methyltransferase (adenine-specific)
VNPALFSNVTGDWATPVQVYRELNAEFHFTLDPCPLQSRNHGGLTRSWKGENVFCNPPYGPGIEQWLRKSREAALAVYLLPSRTDTAWWHNWAMLADEICFIRGRLKFGSSKNSAPFPSCVLVFREVSR